MTPCRMVLLKIVMTCTDTDRFGLVYTTTVSAHDVAIGCKDSLPTVKLSLRKRESMNMDPKDWKTVRIYSGNLN